jgi:hypothetical protein
MRKARYGHVTSGVEPYCSAPCRCCAEYFVSTVATCICMIVLSPVSLGLMSNKEQYIWQAP